ncbi:MAG: tyrosine-type recombinase/integrase, partial [Candidatus Thorarchaeota archaeon]
GPSNSRFKYYHFDDPSMAEEHYRLEGRLKSYLKRIQKRKDILPENKKAIKAFSDSCIREGLTISCVAKYLNSLTKIGGWTKKDFLKCGKKDIEKIVDKIQKEDCSEWTKHAHKVALKKFFRLLKETDEYPEEVRWIKTSVKRRNHKLPEELLNENEVLKMIDHCENLRDRAIISFLWESGCRVGELLSLRVKHVEFDEDGYARVIIPEGKTGPRRLRCVSSAPHLNMWLQNHPLKENKNSALWVGIGTVGRNKPLMYSAVRKLLANAAKRTGVKKAVNPHNFRHSRATFLANHMTESQMKQYLGWVQDSSMAAVYVHLAGRDTDEAIDRMHGIDEEEGKRESVLKPKECLRCRFVNPSEFKFCGRCTAPLTTEVARSLWKETEKLDEMFSKVLEDPEVQASIMRSLKKFNGLSSDLQ